MFHERLLGRRAARRRRLLALRVRRFGSGWSDKASMDKNDSMDVDDRLGILKRSRNAVAKEPAIMSNVNPAPTCGCPVAAFQKMISGKYKLRIVWDLQHGPKRYGEIRIGLLRGADGSRDIAPRVLSRELKALTVSGLIDRKDFGMVPPKVEYRLTRKGRSFIPVISAIRNWGARHLAEAGSGQTIDAAAE
jgi:DNA-binding HxlR family transcriptional regulator